MSIDVKLFNMTYDLGKEISFSLHPDPWSDEGTIRIAYVEQFNINVDEFLKHRD